MKLLTVIMVMVRTKQLYLMLDGYRDSSQDIEMHFSEKISQGTHFNVFSIIHSHVDE